MIHCVWFTSPVDCGLWVAAPEATQAFYLLTHILYLFHRLSSLERSLVVWEWRSAEVFCEYALSILRGPSSRVGPSAVRCR